MESENEIELETAMESETKTEWGLLYDVSKLTLSAV